MSKSLFLGTLSAGTCAYFYFNKNYYYPSPSTRSIDYYKVRLEIQKILERPEGWDNYNHIGPLLVRLSWHASGTYDKNDKTGGSNGSTMRF
jgi:cytochrome c peroxidase